MNDCGINKHINSVTKEEKETITTYKSEISISELRRMIFLTLH
jgi:hypothetical protein